MIEEDELFWDAGNMGCGELLIELRFKMAELKPGQLVKLVAHDPGAPEDMPAWCKMTGHRLVKNEHPQYWIEKKSMPGKFCVNLTSSADNTDKATVGFVLANAAVASDKETMVFLSTEGVRLASAGFADSIHEEGFSPLRELMDNFVKAGGKIFVCSPCYKKRGLDENKLVVGATIVGGAKLVEFLSTDGGSPCITY